MKIESTLSKRDGKRKMKTFKRIMWVMLGVLVLAVIGYFIFTGINV